MSIKEGETTFELSRPINYSRGGNSQVHATTVTLREPGMDHVKYYLKLRQMLTRVQMEFAKQAESLKAIGEQQKALHENAEEIETEGDDMDEVFAMLLMASSTVNVADFVDIFRQMVVKSARKAVCLFDDIQPMTDALWDKLTPDDAFNMAIRWCVFFAIPSVADEKTTSVQPSGSPTELREA